MFREWLRPPQLRSGEGADEIRHATWLELFYDLVFVVAIAELAHNLSTDLSLTGTIEFFALFVPVWWAWIGSTFYATRFDTDDIQYRLLTGVEMFAVVALATTIHDGLGATSTGFALSYAGIRSILVIKYYRARRHVTEARPLINRFATGFAIAAALWIVSVLIPTPYRFGVWALALAISFATPITAGQLHADIPPHASHLPERFGLFTIIVLGEIIVGVVTGVSEQAWTVQSFAIAVFSTGIAFSLWWIYFDNHDGSAIRAAQVDGRVLVYQEWLYGHLPFTIGLTALGVGVLHVLQSDLTAPLPVAERWLICGSLGLCLISLGLLQRTTLACAGEGGGSREQTLFRYGTGVVVVGIGGIGGGLTPVSLVGVLTLVAGAQVVIDLYEREPASNPLGME